MTVEQQITWFSRILRWLLGTFFIATGIWFYEKGAWPAILFGLVIFLTGFLKPKRCIEQGDL